MNKKLIFTLSVFLTLSLTTACILLLSSCSGSDSYSYNYEIDYEISGNGENTYYVSKITLFDKNTIVEIPSTYNDLPVVGIGSKVVKYGGSIYELIIPKSIKYIADHAFYGVSEDLKKVTFESGSALETIGKYAFYGSFGYGFNLEINLQDTQVKSIDDYAFGKYVYNSYYGIFEAESGTRKLVNCVLPKTLKYLGNYALGATETIGVEDVAEFCKVQFSGNRFVQLTHNGEIVTKVTIPDSLTEIPEILFNSFADITEIVLPKNVTKIGRYAFSRTSIRTISLPDTLTVIENGAFYDCKNLSAIILPENVTKIEASVFENCESLRSVVLGETLSSIGERAFFGCKKLINISIPATVNTISKEAFSGCESLKSVSLASGLEKICESVFENCKSLNSVTLPDTVQTIEGKAFFNCEKIKEINIPSEVKKIGAYSFNQTGLERAYFEVLSGWNANGNFGDTVLSDPENAALCLRLTYSGYTWTRKE